MSKRMSHSTVVVGLVAGILATMAPDAQAALATGGNVVTYAENGTNWTAHIFTTVGSNNLNFTSGGNVEALVVGGGGGGGSFGGGGGAGGVVYSNNYAVVGGNYTVTVGGGGHAFVQDKRVEWYWCRGVRWKRCQTRNDAQLPVA